MKKIIKMTNDEPMNFFLKSSSYCNIDLPTYFDFQPLIDSLISKISGKQISDFYKNKRSNPPNKFENINYKFLNNKDGKYSWRPFELIHPVIYIRLVARNVQIRKLEDNNRKI